MKKSLTALFAAAVLFGSIASSALAYTGNCGYYTNSSGHTVPRPCGNASADTPPPGSTAICRDGTFSFSEHHSGACSRHGGVERWR